MCVYVIGGPSTACMHERSLVIFLHLGLHAQRFGGEASLVTQARAGLAPTDTTSNHAECKARNLEIRLRYVSLA